MVRPSRHSRMNAAQEFQREEPAGEDKQGRRAAHAFNITHACFPKLIVVPADIARERQGEKDQSTHGRERRELARRISSRACPPTAFSSSPRDSSPRTHPCEPVGSGKELRRVSLRFPIELSRGGEGGGRGREGAVTVWATPVFEGLSELLRRNELPLLQSLLQVPDVTCKDRRLDLGGVPSKEAKMRQASPLHAEQGVTWVAQAR
eukprot:741132-Hanusia_phi.AAC.3